MLDPIVGAVEVWLVIFGALPYSISSLMNFSLGLMLLVAIFHNFYNIRS